MAYDVCVANMLLNYLAETGGKPYDEGGRLAREGKPDRELLDRLNTIPYYSQEGAKSLGREWFERHVFPLFERSSLSLRDQLATATEHIAGVVADDLTQKKLKTVLVSGGGAFNEFLIERMKSHSRCEIILPSADIINFKEAIIFAFLGYLRLQEKVNTLSAVTGASGDSCGGAVYIG